MEKFKKERMIQDINYTEKKATRNGFGDGLKELGRMNNKVVALCADLLGSLKMNAFVEENPERYIQVGIAEANMIGLAAGLATAGKIPFTGTFANFSTGRVYDQIRQSVAYSGKNVKICASHAGLTLGEDGATHQILEDIGMMKMLPGMTVINPADYTQTKLATLAIADWYGPVYLRFGRPSWPVFTDGNQDFQIGKAQILHEGRDITLIATGHMVWQAIEAAKVLDKEGVSVHLINMHTIKPLDEKTIIEAARKTNCIVTCEEHQYNGGLGESIARVVVQNSPCPVEFVAVNDSFGESGKPEQLLDKYGLGVSDILLAARKVLNKK